MEANKNKLTMQVKHMNELLGNLGVDMDLTLEWAYGQPKLVSHDGSQEISSRQSKPDMQHTISAIRNILFEICRVQRKS
tara:strand:+ start:999 stop:1235 length:237 start_codon:yes stop_codon:yes gene_type:complete